MSDGSLTNTDEMPIFLFSGGGKKDMQKRLTLVITFWNKQQVKERKIGRELSQQPEWHKNTHAGEQTGDTP